MKKDILLPQGKFKIGRDLPAGIYLMAGLNDLSYVTIKKPEEDVSDMYTLDEDNAKMVHIEVNNGDIVEIDGRVKARQIKDVTESETKGFSLIDEIEKFEMDLKSKSVKKNSSKTIEEVEPLNEEDADIGTDEDDYVEDEEDIEENIIEDVQPQKQKIGFWKALGMLFSSSYETHSTSDSSSSFWSAPKKKNTGRCDGDCANCPPHYGYRYGRWYYGKDHTEGCTRGGNRGGGGII